MTQYTHIRTSTILLVALLAACGGGGDTQVTAAPTERPSNLGYTTVTADDLMDWAEQTYPQYFPGRQATLTWAPYVYRYYEATKHHLGLENDKIYVMGPLSSGGLLQVGTVYEYACAVKPADCIAPGFANPPASRMVFPGRTPVFEATASGGPSLQYQWFRNGAPIPGAIGSSYTLTAPATAADAGTEYAVRVSNLKGSITSPPAAVVVVQRVERATLESLSRNLGCVACHDVEARLNAPSFKAVAERHTPRQDSFAYVAGRITGGSRGAWGEVMAPNTEITAADAAALATAILSLAP